MPEVPREIMNILRRDLHASETFISADHPDAKTTANNDEQDTQSKPKRFINRYLGRHTLDTSSDTLRNTS